MKILPKYPYLQNVITTYNKTFGFTDRHYNRDWSHYREWMANQGFEWPILDDRLVFKNISEEDYTMFCLKFS